MQVLLDPGPRAVVGQYSQTTPAESILLCPGKCFWLSEKLFLQLTASPPEILSVSEQPTYEEKGPGLSSRARITHISSMIICKNTATC